MKSLGTLSIKDVLKCYLSDNLRRLLPMDMKIAFPHPIRSDILIFIGGDMPHLVKKFVNTLERSGEKDSTNLFFENNYMSLKTLENVWKKSAGSGMGSIRTNNLTHEHFHKNAYSRMRVHLAVQVVSQSMIRLIDKHASECGGIEKYQSLKKIITSIDRLVDICNNTAMNNQKEFKGCEMINNPNHYHLTELLDILEIFATWKEATANEKTFFIPWQSYEDLIWLVIGIVGISKTYLKEDNSRTMIQRNGGTDDCENEFAGTKQRNNKPSSLDCNQITSRRTGVRAHSFTKKAKNNTSGDTELWTDELIGKMEKKSTKRKRKEKEEKQFEIRQRNKKK